MEHKHCLYRLLLHLFEYTLSLFSIKNASLFFECVADKMGMVPDFFFFFEYFADKKGMVPELKQTCILTKQRKHKLLILHLSELWFMVMHFKHKIFFFEYMYNASHTCLLSNQNSMDGGANVQYIKKTESEPD